VDERRERRSVSTGKGDDGTTGLLYAQRRVFKDDPMTEACGAIDEAVAALGLVRADVNDRAAEGRLPASLVTWPELLLRFQRELFVAGAQLATPPEAADRLEPGRTAVSAAMVAGLEKLLAEAEASVGAPTEFVVPGETRLSAAVEAARTAVRRAERRAVTVARVQHRVGDSAGDQLIPYLNRLADLLWILARVAERADLRAPVPANEPQHRRNR